MCINSNNVVINNNSYKALRPYFAVQNSHSHRKDFFEIYRQFWQATSEGFASRGLTCLQGEFWRRRNLPVAAASAI